MAAITYRIISHINSEEITGFIILINSALKIPQALPWQNEISADTAKDYLQNFINNPDALVVFIYTEEMLAAAGILSTKDQISNIELICIDPQKHGLGIGPLLINTFEEFASTSGCSKIFANSGNIKRLDDFYERSGFIREGDKTIKYLIGNS